MSDNRIWWLWLLMNTDEVRAAFAMFWAQVAIASLLTLLEWEDEGGGDYTYNACELEWGLAVLP